MERQIKFRAWDKTYKRMNYKVQVGNTDYSDKNYTCNSLWVDYSDKKSIGWMNFDNTGVEILQYTGLKDKKGREIYEGDIVKITDGREASHHLIIWDNEQCRFIDKRLEDGDCVTNYLNGEFDFVVDGYVVGNKYENPELLEK